MLSTDPHLSSTIPAFWQLQELIWDDKFVTGASLVGVPGISMGRTEHLTWGLTAAIVDNSDLWEEEINEAGTHYLVEGEWRELEIIEEVVKVKGKEDMTLKIKLTHRGPLMEVSLLRFNAGLLFGGTIPEIDDGDKTQYSFGWGGAVIGDHSIELLTNLAESPNLVDFRQRFENMTEGTGYRGVAANMMMADSSGNIAYQMAVPMRRRKDETPYLGCRVLDGRTTQFDWTDEVIPLKELPRVLNPEKGYLANANNRQWPDSAKKDYGATIMSTGRSVRIDELIREKIESGQKFKADDMIAIQLDTIDVFARRMIPYVTKLAG